MIPIRVTRCIITFLAALAVISVTCTVVRAQVGGEGTSFVLTVPDMLPLNGFSPSTLKLILTSDRETTVTVTYSADNSTSSFLLPASSFQEIVIDSLLVQLPSQEGKFRRTVQVQSTQPITAMMLVDRESSTEAYAAIPDSLLGLEYYAVAASDIFSATFVTISGSYDNTDVTVIPAARTVADHVTGQPFTIRLNRGDVYQILTDPFENRDLTGTKITATKPVGVLSGATCAVLPIGPDQTCNPLVEQIPPVSFWGNRHYLQPFIDEDSTMYSVVAGCDDVDASQLGANTLEAGGHTLRIARELDLQTVKPALVGHIGATTYSRFEPRDKAYGDPSMALITPESQMATGHRFFVPFIPARSDRSPPISWKYYVTIVRQQGPPPVVTLDGAAVNFAGNRSVVEEVGPGVHAVSSSLPVAVYINGYSISDAFAYVPSVVGKGYGIQTGEMRPCICSDVFDTTITVTNTSGTVMVIDSLVFVGNLDGEVLGTTTPFLLLAGEQKEITIRFSNISGNRADGSLVMYSGDCQNQELVLPIEFVSERLTLVPSEGSTVLFPSVTANIPYAEQKILLYNAGKKPLVIRDTILSSSLFWIANLTLPITLPPANTLEVTLRFSPDGLGERTGSVSFLTGNCADSVTKMLVLTGTTVVGGYIISREVPPIQLLCETKEPRQFTVTIVNSGDQPLTIDEGMVVGNDAGEFALLSPIPAVIRAGDSIMVTVEYTPNGLGKRDVAFRIISDAVNTDTLLIPLDIRNDTAALAIDFAKLDFGTLFFCDGEFSLRQLQLVNTGTVRATGLQITTNEPERYVLTPQVPLSLDAGDTFNLVIQPLPNEYGMIQDTLVISIAECDRTLSIPLKGERAKLAAISANSLTFECDDVGTERTLTISVANGSASEEYVFGSELLGETDGVRVSPVDVLRVSPNESGEITITYAPGRYDTLNGTLQIIQYFPCADTFLITLEGEPCWHGGVRLVWEDAEQEVGKNVGLRLIAIQEEPEGITDSVLLHTTLQMNASMLLPTGFVSSLTQGTINIVSHDVSGDIRQVEFEIRGVLPDSGVVLELDALVTLGDNEQSPLAFTPEATTVKNLVTGDMVTDIQTKDGEFQALGICLVGPHRLVRVDGAFKLNILPNPVRSNAVIEFSIVEDGVTRIEMYNGDGRRVALFLDGEMTPGAYQTTIEVVNFPSGIYYLALTTPTQKIRKKFVVTR